MRSDFYTSLLVPKNIDVFKFSYFTYYLPFQLPKVEMTQKHYIQLTNRTQELKYALCNVYLQSIMFELNVDSEVVYVAVHYLNMG